jgi:hypothetical protein
MKSAPEEAKKWDRLGDVVGPREAAGIGAPDLALTHLLRRRAQHVGF